MPRLFLVFFIVFFTQKAHSEECRFLDWETAWQRILSYAPSIAAADTEICIREAEKKQVSTIPNPVAAVSSENLGVAHPNKDTDPPQTTYSLSQTLELGGKRGARHALAASVTSIAYWDAQIERQNARHALTIAFIEIGVAQEQFKLAKERLCVADRMLQVACTQVEGGKVSPIQEKKARIALMAEQLSVKKSLSELAQAKQRLSSMWGSSCPDFDGIIFKLFDYSPPPCQSCVVKGLFQMPDFTRAQQLVFSAGANLTLQKANRIPDVTVTAGYRVFNDSNQNGWVVGAALPIPFFNRNQGNIQKAYWEISQAESQLDEIERELKEKLFSAYEQMVIAFETSEMIRTGVLTEAMEACELTQKGYLNGKFEYMDLLETQKILFEVQEKYIEILYGYHLNRAELARLSGECHCMCFQ